MISDVMFEAVSEVDRYLKEMPNVYVDVLPQCLAVRKAMNDLRIVLDTPPTQEQIQECARRNNT